MFGKPKAPPPTPDLINLSDAEKTFVPKYTTHCQTFIKDMGIVSDGQPVYAYLRSYKNSKNDLWVITEHLITNGTEKASRIHNKDGMPFIEAMTHLSLWENMYKDKISAPQDIIELYENHASPHYLHSSKIENLIFDVVGRAHLYDEGVTERASFPITALGQAAKNKNQIIPQPHAATTPP
jgi:hypothetical protein